MTTRGQYMAVEIAEQPQVWQRVLADGADAIAKVAAEITDAAPRFVLFVGRGSSDHAALYGKYLVEITHGLPAGLVSPSTMTTLVPDTNMFDVPDGLDDARAAALGNGGLAEFMPLRDGAAMRPGERVLILGATGIVGRLAIQCAAALGAGQIVAAGRDREALDRAAELVASSTISLTGGRPLDDIIRGAAPAGFDIILDYLGGEPASAASRVLAPRGRLIQIGDRAGHDMTLALAPLRAVGASIIGFLPAYLG
jgi:NADPH:quinone reductase-like Zn-dependent oxidoreductase